MMTRPRLNEVPIPNPLLQPGKLSVTMNPGQWDNLLSAAYRFGATLLEVEEVDGQEKIVRAYQLDD